MNDNKYTHIASLIRKISIEQDPIQIDKQYDDILGYLFLNWPSPPSRITNKDEALLAKFEFTKEEQEAVDIFNSTTGVPDPYYFDKLSAYDPPYYSELLYPIMVSRYLLRELRLLSSYHGVPNFDEFYSRYARIITGPSSKPEQNHSITYS
jgi:hypothetical protein